jgi:putative ABC transport system permease protein
MKWWWQLNKSDADLERELRTDLELEEEEQRKSGVPPEEASYAARRAFGNKLLIKEQTREAWGWVPFERVSQDVRFAIRQLAKNAGFTAACLITLALGIGATVTIFTVMDSLLLRPLPYPNSPRVVGIWNTFAPRGMMEIPLSEPEFVEYRRSQSFDHLAGFSVGALSLTGSGDPLRVAASWGTSDFFAVMGTQPLLGRVFSDDEQQLGHTQVAVLSYRLWQSRFGSNPNIVGESILLNGQSCVVVGVMPRNFNFPSNDVDIWQPLPIESASSNLGNHYLNLIADLKPRATLGQARSEMATILAQIQRKYPAYYGGAVGMGVGLVPLREQMVGNLRPTVLILMAGVGFMLLIACLNVASLLLARGEDRKQEIATRTALGATRRRILCQVLIENLLLFLAGGILALLLALVCLKVLTLEDYLNVAQLGGVTLNARVFVFATIVSILTGLLSGLIPALKASQLDFNDTLKGGGRDAMGSRHRSGTRGLLVSSEIAFSLVLLTGAGLMIGSLVKLLGVSLGFNPENVITMRLSLPEARYSLSQTATFYNQLQDGVQGLPDVQAVAIVNQLPMSDVTANSSFEVEGRPSDSDINVADTKIISPDYFRVMGISLMRGRVLNEQDAKLPPASVIVNQTFAHKVWSGIDPIGKRIRLRSDAPWLSVVGVVADIKNHGSNTAAKPEMYFLLTDQPFGIWTDLRSMTLVVRTASESQQIVGAIRGQLKYIDPELPIYKVSTLAEIVSSSVSQTRFPALTLSLFACTALILAAIGVYGVLAYTVAQSRHEIGVRMALGAQQGQVLSFFLGQGVRWVALGGGAGLTAALMLVHFMRSMLFQISPYDPRILLAVSAVLSVVVLMACFIPASRATKVDPMAALRSE